MTLERRTPLRAKPRSKGNRAERAVVDILRTWGWKDAKRNWQSGGQGGGDIIEGPADVHLEVKHHERCTIWDWIAQAEGEARPTDIPVVVLRDNKHSWWCVLPADEWDALWQLLLPRGRMRLERYSERCLLWKWIDEAEEKAPVIASDALPSVRFSRNGGPVYEAVPFGDLLVALKVRERAL